MRYKKVIFTVDERREYMRNFMASRRRWYEEYKKTLSCNRCGFSHPAAMQFHHLSGDKTMAVSKMVHLKGNVEEVIREIEKCEVLCANCHFIHHFEEGLKGKSGRPKDAKPKCKIKGVTYHVI